MLDLNTIKEISGQKGVSEIIIEKDYVLDWLLWGISQIQNMRTNLIFKGATSLHKMYFPDWRFSEDLDFTTIENLNEDEIKEIIPLFCKTIQDKSEIAMVCKEIKPAGEEDNQMWSCEVKIEYIGPRKQGRRYKPIVKLHITNNEPLLIEPHLKILLNPWSDIEPNFTIFTYSLEEIIAEKLRTVLHQRCLAKDVYDVWRLIKGYKSFINIPTTLDIYFRKCKHSGIIAGIPNNLKDQIDRLKEHWDRGLKFLLKDAPAFDRVSTEILPLIEDIFSEKYNAKGGRLKMLESNYSIRYRRGDLEIEVQGDKNFVETNFKELLELKRPVEAKQPIITGEVQLTDAGKKYSLAEFLKTKDAKNHGDKILVFAYYLQEYENISSFNLDDIEQCYMKVKVPKTTNFSPYFTQLVSKGYIMDATEKKDNKKSWTLTNSGDEYVGSLSRQEA